MTDQIFAGKVAIVTGATGSIGQAIVSRLAEAGARVVGCSRNAESGEAMVRAMRERGLDVRFIAADVGTEPAVQAIVAEAIETYGRLDVVINGAAAVEIIRSGQETNVVELPTETFRYELTINLFAPFWFFKYAIPHMQAVGGGAFVNCSTLAAHRLQPGMPAYASGKAALEALSQQVAVEYGPDNIRSNCLVIGSIQNAVNGRLHAHPVAGRMLRSAQALDRAGLPEFVADAAAFLASDQSRFTTGSNVMVEGGAIAKSALPDAAAVYREMQAYDAAAGNSA
jgi:NAD(P)-dependent dehydrogenase (short-subunit alcohol dehydrogenase family)